LALDDNIVPLANDIIAEVRRVYPGSQGDAVTALLLEAKGHDGAPASARLVRCALVAAGGSIVKLRHYVGLMAVDSRDVIVAGEYESRSGRLARVRDLNNPL